MRLGWALYDLAALVAFTLIGIYSHHQRLPSVDHFWGVFWPFAAGWYGLGLLTGLYRVPSWRGAFWLTWLVGCAVGVMLYSWVTMARPVAWWSINKPFWVLSTVFIGLLTGGARLIALAVNRSRRRLAS